MIAQPAVRRDYLLAAGQTDRAPFQRSQGGVRPLLGPAARGQKRGGEGGEEEKEEKEGEKEKGKRGEKRGGDF